MKVYLFLILLLLTLISLADQTNELRFDARPIGEAGEISGTENRKDVWGQLAEKERDDQLLTIRTSSWWLSFESYFFGLLMFFFGLLIRRERMSRRRLQVEVSPWKVEASRLKELTKIKSEFCQGLCDDLCLPLTLEQESAQKLPKTLNHPPDDPEHQMISRAKDRLFNPADHVDALSHTGSEASRGLVCADVLSFLSTLSKAYSTLFETKGIRYTPIFDHQSLWAFFDPKKLEKIISYLVSNAYKFTASGKEVMLEVYTEAISPEFVTLCIKITEQRAGTREEPAKGVVDRSRQADTAKHDSCRGMGLSLFLVKKWVMLLGGDITFQTESGVGTTSSVTIPLRVSERVDAAWPLSWKAPESTPDFSNTNGFLSHGRKSKNLSENRGRPSVLVVASDQSPRRIISSFLRPLYDVYEANDELAGWDLVQRIVPDLIISDVTGDQRHGIGLCERAKSDTRTSHIAFILLAADSSEENMARGLCASPDECLTKLFDIEKLKLSIQNVLERKLLQRFDRSVMLQPETVIERSRDEKFLLHIHSILDKHVNNPNFCIDLFCREAGMSRVNLYRRLKALTNQSPGELVRDFRLKRATMLLEQEYGNVSEVAYAVGFNSASYFARSFRSKYGQTPSDFLTSLNHQKPDRRY